MVIISHRGNLEGPNSCSENSPTAIERAIELGFDCEVDVWVENEKIFLGHDFPEHQIEIGFLTKHKHNLWVHCKNADAVEFLALNAPYIHFFWHQTDDYTITSRGMIWIYPGRPIIRSGVGVLPEIWGTEGMGEGAFNALSAICTDFPNKYKNDDIFHRSSKATL
jgi:hypothetical protein